MFQNTKSSVKILGGATAVTLVLGLNAAAGVLPRLVGTTAAASVSQTALAPGVDAVAPDTATVPTAVVTTTVVAPAAPPPAVKKLPVRQAAAPAPGPRPAPGPAAPTLAPRTQPTGGQISQAIQGLRPYVFLFSPSPAQVVQAGDKVCTAFDEGKTFAEVKAMGLAAVAHIPLIGVSAGAADYVVRTGVALFCPAYQSKLV